MFLLVDANLKRLAEAVYLGMEDHLRTLRE